jgi:hypothetical protein
VMHLVLKIDFCHTSHSFMLILTKSGGQVSSVAIQHFPGTLEPRKWREYITPKHWYYYCYGVVVLHKVSHAL